MTDQESHHDGASAGAETRNPATFAGHQGNQELRSGSLVLLLAACLVAFGSILPAAVNSGPWNLQEPAFTVHQGAFAAILSLAAAAGVVMAWRRWGTPPGAGDASQANLGLVLGGLWVAYFASAVLMIVFDDAPFPGGFTLAVAAAVAGYAAWAVRFSRRFPSDASTMDQGLKVGLLVIGILLALLSILFFGLVQLGVCYSGCDAPRSMVPFGMLLAPLGYLAVCLAWLRARRLRAEREPEWAETVSRTPGVAASIAVVLILALLAFVATCFGLVAIGVR
jgi:hypothetical protein